MRWILLIAAVLILAGAALIVSAVRLPVYTDANAPERLSRELETRPRETRFKEWYSRLPAYETAHKKLSDCGRGLVAAGAGLLLAVGIWTLYHRFSWMRTGWAVFIVWILLWVARIPFTAWYYGLRQQRFDYPVWGDSIAIPVVSESITWIAGAVISSLVLAALLYRHPLPRAIRIARPHSVLGWIRAVVIGCWIAILGLCVATGIPDGDEGIVLTATAASVILLAFLSARDAATSKKNNDTSLAHPTIEV